MPIGSPRLLLDGLVFPEGPRWHQGKLWFSDMFSNRVMTVDLDGNSQVLYTQKERPSGIGWLPDGTTVFTSMNDCLLLRLVDGGAETVAEMKGIPCDQINDMVVDGQGRAYIDSRLYDTTPGGPAGGIILVTPDGAARQVADELDFPNGVVVLPDGQTLVIAESQGHRLTAFHIEEDGSLSGRRVFADLGDVGPDGICLDAEGAIWVGSPGAHAFLRVREGGEVTDQITVEGRMAVACALGGPEMRTLFLTSARSEGEKIRSLARGQGNPWELSSGLIETVEVDVPGAGWP